MKPYLLLTSTALIGVLSFGSLTYADGRSLHPVDNEHLIHYESDRQAFLITVGDNGTLSETSLGISHVQQVSSTSSGWVAACSAVGNELAIFHVSDPEKIYSTKFEVRKIEGYLTELDALLEEGQVSESELEQRFTMERMTVQYENEAGDCYGLHLHEDEDSKLFVYVANLIPAKLQKLSVSLKDDGEVELSVDRLFRENYNGVRNVKKFNDKLFGLSSETHGNSWIWFIDESSEAVLGGHTQHNGSSIWNGKTWSTSLSTGVAEDAGKLFFVDRFSGQLMTIDTNETINDTQADLIEVGQDYLYGVAAAAGKVVVLGQNANGNHVLTEFRQSDTGLIKVNSKVMVDKLQDVAVTPDGTVYVASQTEVRLVAKSVNQIVQ